MGRFFSRLQNFSTARRANLHDEEGHAILEFALIVPLIVFILVATVEFTHLFRVRELMIMVAREAGSTTFRSCFELEPQECAEGLGSEIDLCLTTYAGEAFGVLKSKLQRASLTISMWKWNEDTQEAELIGITLKDVKRREPTRSEYTDVRVKADMEDLMRAHKIIVISEVWFDYPYYLLKGVIPELEMYNATVF